MSLRTLALSLLGAASLAAASGVTAQGSIELGGFGTYTQFDKSLGLTDKPGGGARFSLISGSGFNTWVLEAEGAYVSSTLGPTQIRYIPARARLMYALPLGGNASFLLGGGAVRNDYSDGTASSNEWGYSGLVGLRMRLGTFMTLRLDGVMDYITNPIGKAPGHTRVTNRGAQIGLGFPIWTEYRVPEPKVARAPEPKPAPVVQAPAPAPVQQAAPQSGPDADRDGVSDDRDACSNTPAGATVDRDGCPVYRDTDGDGVIDLRDACPATSVGEMVDGRGCSIAKDSDGDGVSDVSDRCPNTPMGERVDARGCVIVAAAPPPAPAPAPAPKPDLDRDGDGVPDSRDKCPDTAAGAQADANGCPILFKGNDRTVTLRGVTFQVWSDELTPRSQQILDDVAEQLIAAPDVRVEIAGHTDAGGARTKNIKLSLDRAQSVRAYLTMRGVAPERMVARGYGPDQPLASNATPAGRAMNRRVELRRLN